MSLGRDYRGEAQTEQRDRSLPLRDARRRLERVVERIAGHKVAVRAQGETFIAPHAVLVLLEDVEAAARGEMR
jgi:hypothetical protein